MFIITNKRAAFCATMLLALTLAFTPSSYADDAAKTVATPTATASTAAAPVTTDKPAEGGYFSGFVQKIKKYYSKDAAGAQKPAEASAPAQAQTTQAPAKEAKPAVKKEVKKDAAKKAEEHLKVKPKEKPQAVEKSKSTQAQPVKKASMASASTSNEKKDFMQEGDIDEALPLPSYPAGAVTITGKNEDYTLGEEDTLLDIGRFFDLGFIEILAANPGIDSWTPMPERKITLPRAHLLPRTERQEGVIVNLAQMRLYYFNPSEKGKIYSFPIGIGREGLQTPIGHTTIVRKVASPIWSPTDRMREEKPWLPRAVPAGPSNPLGEYALYLGWPTFLIHGSNKPWAIGRRVSSGCMRMYPENIQKVFELVPVGAKVTVVNQPVLVAEVQGKLYIEVNPSIKQGNSMEVDESYDKKPLTSAIRKVIEQAAGNKAKNIKWDVVEKAFEERHGYPILIE